MDWEEKPDHLTARIAMSESDSYARRNRLAKLMSQREEQNDSLLDSRTARLCLLEMMYGFQMFLLSGDEQPDTTHTVEFFDEVYPQSQSGSLAPENWDEDGAYSGDLNWRHQVVLDCSDAYPVVLN